MKWRGRRSSTNVEDARNRKVVAGSAMGATIMNLVARRWGVKGIIVVLGGALLLWMAGIVDPMSFLTGAPTVREENYQPTAEEQTRYEFVTVVLADTEDIWSAEFQKRGGEYKVPTLVVYRQAVNTACGPGQAAMGPFYCPGDRRVYVDLGFYDELEADFDAPGDFAQAYVIAHEIGHHVQNLLGISDEVHKRRGSPDFNQWSVRLELQADFLAGVWAHHNRHYLDRGDIEEAMRAANAIGDDAIQKRMRGRVVPHAFTHGTSEQRMRWFDRGLQSGRLEDGDSFAIEYDDL